MQTTQKIVDKSTAREMLKKWQSLGEKVVFTNGCFDILHAGHVDYLEKARELGDRLVVGINTDSSVKRLKGPKRPINDEFMRKKVMAALQCVDLVVPFEEDTPRELISTLLPDYLVKGNDYLAENIVGAEIVLAHGGAVKTLPLVHGYSTTGIIEKIKSTD